MEAEQLYTNGNPICPITNYEHDDAAQRIQDIETLLDEIVERITVRLLEKTEIADWAKQERKPSYTAAEVGADTSGSANQASSDAKEYADGTYRRAAGYTDEAIAGLINGAPTTLDTLKEIADALAKNEDVVNALDAAIGNKVEKVSGKGLSANDYTTTEKNKLKGIAAGAEVNVNSDWNETDKASDAYIKNKPAIPTVHNGTLTIQRNGTDIQSFSANQAGDVTVNISVPTKVSQIENDSGYATKASPTFTGSPKAPTPAESDNSTRIATTAFVKAIVSALINGAPETLDTFGEIAEAFAENDTVINALNEAIGKKLSKTEAAVSAEKWTNGRNVNGLIIDGTSNRANYGTCSTAAATAAKTVSCTGFGLVTGAEITVRFTVTNTAANPTLNVNGTGAKPIYYRGAAISAGYLAANRTYIFRYNGTQWDLVGDINTNTTYGLATASNRGLVKVGYTENGKNYPVELSNEQMYVSVPWTDTNTWKANTKDQEGYVAKGNGQANKVWKTDADGVPGWRADANTTYPNFVKSGTGAKSGLVPAPSTTAGTSKYLREDGTWQTPPNTTYGVATQSTNGLMTAADKKKLDGVVSGANAYSLPLATSSVRGGVKTGYSSNGKNYPVQLSNEQMYVNVPWTDTNTTYADATTSTHGLMSAADKAKLNSIATGANKTTITNSFLVTASGTAADGMLTKELKENVDDIYNKLSKIGTVVYGTKLNKGVSVANGSEVKLAEIVLSPGVWLIIACGWGPIGASSLIDIEGYYAGIDCGPHMFNATCIVIATNQKTVNLKGFNYSGSAQSVGASYDFQAVRIG